MFRNAVCLIPTEITARCEIQSFPNRLPRVWESESQKINLPERGHLDSIVICKVGIPGHIQPFIGRHSQPEELQNIMWKKQKKMFKCAQLAEGGPIGYL